MQIIMNVWLAFNIVFGLWSFRNWALCVKAFFAGKSINQNTLGKMLDLVVPVSIIAYILTTH